jgi:sarcosine oxidase
MTSYDYIIIGAGAAGSATAYQLAKDGANVLLLEQFSIAHERGSSHGESRIFRFAYPQLEYTRFAKQCLPLWKTLEAETGKELLITTGGLDFADDETGYDSIYEVKNALEQAECRVEFLEYAALKTRFPQWKLKKGAIGVYSPDAGILKATECVQTMVAEAIKHGATVHENEAVQHIDYQEDKIFIKTSKNHFQAKKLIITAGAWLNTLLKDVGEQLELKITQEQYLYLDLKKRAKKPVLDTIWIHYRKEFMYGFPDLGTGYKCGWHHSNIEIDITAYTPKPSEYVQNTVQTYMAEYRPQLAAAPSSLSTCLYTTTPDQHFILDFLPQQPNILIGSPCSGHGFKFAVGIGRALADLAQHGKTDMEIGHLRKWGQ